ncbi:MAG TPA: DUF3375 domain-containing protein [Pseudohongiella sp.]|nr:DUF3375 domain-containing protein [Pseudohongiella sp.]
MSETAQQRTQRYVAARNQHPAWLLLASRRAPLVLGCLRTLFDQAQDGILMEDALQAMSDMLQAYASDELYDIDPDSTQQQAGRELRQWIKRRLVVEREGRIFATDALESAIQFIESLNSRIMTSTASRLSVVQREIENLEMGLNPNPANRIASLKRRIKSMEHELQQAELGNVPVLDEASAIEGIREVYNLAIGLRADFRRVEDSWRDADRALRQSIISDQLHRGEIVDTLLEGHEQLLSTPEGRVFDSFQQQLRQSIELDHMRERLRTILRHPVVSKALARPQQSELRSLVVRLVKESESVLQARARSERDVKGFLKTGLAAEHHRVGQLLNEFFTAAMNLDWQRQSVRRQAVPLPPVAIGAGAFPAIERLRFKAGDDSAASEPDLRVVSAGLDEIADDFWDAFDGLDRDALINETLATLREQGKPLSLGELAALLPPSHDLETFALWIGMAREAGIEVMDEQREKIEVVDQEQRPWRFDLPYAAMDGEALAKVDWEL